MRKRAVALAVAAMLLAGVFSGCNNEKPQDIEIIPPEQITTLPSDDSYENQEETQPEYNDGDVALDITKLEAGNLYNGGVYYASYHNSYFFNYAFEEGNKTSGQAAMYVKDTYGEIFPLGTVSISFEVPNYPRGIYYLAGVIYYCIPGGAGSGIYQIQSDGTNNRIVIQTPSDLTITQIDYHDDKIFYLLENPNNPDDERAGFYTAQMQDGTASLVADYHPSSFAFDRSGQLYSAEGEDGIIRFYDDDMKETAKIETEIHSKLTNLRVYDNYIYFTADGNGLYRTSFNGKSVECLLENYKVCSFVVVENRIFFAGTDDEQIKSWQLNAIDVTGQNHSVLSIEKVDRVMSDGDWIYCYVMDGNEYADSYRIRTDGSGFESSAIVG